MVPETKVLCFSKKRSRELPALLRASLRLDARAGVSYFERLRFANGEPVILEHRWVRSDLVPGLSANKLAGSFYHYLEEMYGIFMTGERHKIRAHNLSVQEAKKFMLNEGAAVLVVEGTGFTEVELPVWYQVLYYRGDRYELENEVHAGRGPARLTVRRRD
jgi:GntR family transcriptional regulator